MYTLKTPYNSRPSLPESFKGHVSKTESAGYIPPKKIIEQMIMAGLRLKSFREDQFDLQGGQDDDEVEPDPTRRPGFDMADASQIAHELNYRAKRARKTEGSNTSQGDKIDPEASSKEEKGASKGPENS